MDGRFCSLLEVCSVILEVPRTVPGCGQNFCNGCIRWILGLNKISHCQTCATDLPPGNKLDRPPVEVTDLLDQLRIRCTYSPACRADPMELSEVKRHEKWCDHNPANARQEPEDKIVLLACGGYRFEHDKEVLTDSCDLLDLTTGKWAEFCKLPCRMAGTIVVYHGGYVYLFGGHIWWKFHNVINRMNQTTKKKKWVPITYLLEGCSGPGCAVMGDDVYLSSGKQIFGFNTKTEKVRTVCSLPGSDSSVRLFAHQASGCLYSVNLYATPPQAWRYHVATDTHYSVAIQMASGLVLEPQQCRIVPLNDHQFYAVGGFQSKSLALFTIDPSQLVEISAERLPDVNRWKPAAAATDDSQLYLAGGSAGSEASVEKYNQSKR